MKIRTVDISKLNPAAYNPRKDLTPDDPEYKKLEKSIDEFGIVEPIVWNKRTGNIVGGHQRFKVISARGAKETEVVVVDLDEHREMALNIALNKIGGDWDFPKLKDLIVEIDTGEFDIDVTGFDEKELKDIFKDTGIVDKPEVEFTEEIMLEHNYVIFYFDNPLDWQVAIDRLGLKEVKDLIPRKGQPRGIGRVVNGAKWLDRIK